MSVIDAIAQLRAGRPIIVLDDESRENEADLILAAEHASTDTVAFFLEHTSGFLCVALDAQRTADLNLPSMVSNPSDPLGTAFTVSVDAAVGVTTGISAADRARTIAMLGSPDATAADFTRPGHIMPLCARPGGVRERRGHTEAAVDLCRAAGLTPAGLICEMVSSDRRGMLTRDDVPAFASTHGLSVITIDDVVTHLSTTAGITRGASCHIPTAHGQFEATVYTSSGGTDHLVLHHGDLRTTTPLVRAHSECLTGDTLGSARCDCGTQLNAALARLAAAESGVLLYLGGHEGRGIGLAAKIAAYALQDTAGLDTVDANLHLGLPVDARDYTDAAAILADLGINRIALLTNNPAKVTALSDVGVCIDAVVGLESTPTPDNADYLATKRDRMGHKLLGSTGVVA